MGLRGVSQVLPPASSASRPAAEIARAPGGRRRRAAEAAAGVSVAAAGVPVSIGLLRPAIVLPEAMPRQADEEQLQAVLLHEMAHIARHDHWVGVGQRLAAVLFWWNPPVHWVCDEISELREEICDNYVLLVQGEGRRLARILVDLAARATTVPLLPSTVGVLEPRLAGLTGRVLRLLDKERNMETRMNTRSKVLVFAGSVAVLIGMATVGGLQLASAQPAAASQAPVAEKPSATPPAREKLDQSQAVQQDTPGRSAEQPIASDLSAVREELAKRFPTIDQDKLTAGHPGNAESTERSLRRSLFGQADGRRPVATFRLDDWHRRCARRGEGPYCDPRGYRRLACGGCGIVSR